MNSKNKKVSAKITRRAERRAAIKRRIIAVKSWTTEIDVLNEAYLDESSLYES